MKKIIFILLFFITQVSYSQWEKTNWRCDPEIHDIFANDNIIILKTRYDFIISTDYGKQWKKLNQEDLVSEGIVSVAFIDNNIFISTVFGGIYISDNFGNSWSKRNFGLTNRSFIKLFSDGKTIYAGTSGGGVFVSHNLGINWQSINNGLDNLYILKIVAKDQILVASTPDGIFVSTDAGNEWKLKNNGISKDDYFIDEICFLNDNIIISSHEDTHNGSINNIYSSSDSGETWVKRNNSIIANRYSYSMVATSDAIMIQNFEFAYYSYDTCKTWVRVNTDSTSECGIYAIYPKNENIYISIGGELFLTDKDWKGTKKLLTGQKNGQIESMIAINNTLYIGARYGWSCEFLEGIYSSSDFGSNWDTLIKPYINVTSLASNGEVIVAGTKFHSCFISTNGGKNFRISDTPDSVFKVGIISSVVLNDSNIIVCKSSTSGRKGKIFLSSDYGNTWSEKAPALDGIHVLSLTIDDDILYAATENGVYLSSDMGSNWILRNNGIPDDLTISTIEIKGEIIFAGTRNGVYLSSDKGNNWQPINNGLPAKSDIRKIIFAGDIIFVCSFDKGVYMSSDNGKSWISKNEGLDNLKVSTFAIIDNTLFVGTNTTSWGTDGNDAIFKAKINELVTDVENNNEITKNIIYPNPAMDFITLNLESWRPPSRWTPSEIEIYDVMGMKIQTTKVETISYAELSFHELSLRKIDISNLSPGVYFVKINGSNGACSIVEKFVKY